MYSITVSGPNGGKVSSDLSDFCHEAVRTLLAELGICHRYKFALQLVVHHRTTFEPDVEGACGVLGDRSYRIDVCLYTNWLKVLAHECVHLKQFIKGELSPNLDRWKSNRYVSHHDYDNQPWEREAYRLEYSLLNKLF